MKDLTPVERRKQRKASERRAMPKQRDLLAKLPRTEAEQIFKNVHRRKRLR